MRFFGFIFFVGLLTWTWSVMHASPRISFETHAGIQEELAATIIGILQKNKPSITQINIDKMWTETLGDDGVKAHFVYSFSDSLDGSQGLVRSTLQGEAVLKKSEIENQWDLQNFKTTQNNVIFEEPMYINPNREEETDSVTPTTVPSEPATN